MSNNDAIKRQLLSSGIRLQHPDLPNFEPLLRRLVNAAHKGGCDALAAIGHRMEEITQSKGLHRKFIRGCHYSFDRAQRDIGEYISATEEKLSSLRTQTRQLRSTRAPHAHDRIEIVKALEARQLLLRRLIDSIAWTTLAPDQWALRHLSLDRHLKRIDPTLLRRTINDATKRNKVDRLKFNVVCDLTTGIHIGDLLEVDRTSLHICSWKIVELKEGKINLLLTDAIERQQGDRLEETLKQIKDTLGEKAAKQASRMLRQRDRQSEIARMIDGIEAKSPQFEMPVFFGNKNVMVLDDYSEVISRACDEASSQGSSLHTVDKCLRIIAVKAENLPGPEGAAIAHLLHHIEHNEKLCFLNDPARQLEELQAMKEVQPFIDLVAHNMRDSSGMPIFVWGIHDDRLVDLLMSRIRLFVQFDMKLFFELARTEGIELSWIMKRPDAMLRKLSGPIPGSPNSWSVRARFSDGIEANFLCGMFGRVIANLTSPSELLRLMKSYSKFAKDKGITFSP